MMLSLRKSILRSAWMGAGVLLFSAVTALAQSPASPPAKVPAAAAAPAPAAVPTPAALAGPEATPAVAAPPPPPPPAPAITVDVSGLHSSKGKMRIFVFAQEEGFPEKENKAVQHKIVAIQDGKASARFEGLAPGIYAVSTCHDENDNDKCDMNFLGIPKEGVACSNKAHKVFFKPSFKDAKFEYKGGDLAIPVSEIRY